MVDLAERLKALRLTIGLSQKQVSERIGVTASMISAYENGIRQPSYEVLARLSKLLKTTPNFLLGFDEQENGYSLDGLTAEQMETVLKIIRNLKKANNL